ncbi:MAG: ABC transporter permease, partial [Vulcanococcus sp.]
MGASLAAPAGRASAWLTPWLAQLPPPAGELAAVQQRGRRALAEQPLPGAREEAWRFTDLSLLAQLPLQPASAAAPLPTLPPAEPDVLRLHLDGCGDPLAGPDLPDGLQPLSAAELAQGLGHTLAATGCEHHWPV